MNDYTYTNANIILWQDAELILTGAKSLLSPNDAADLPVVHVN